MKGEASILGTGVEKEDLSITGAVPTEVVLHSDLGTGVVKEDLSIIGAVPDDDLDESREDESDLVKLVNLLALVESFEQFTVAVEGQPSEAVEDAIALQNTQPKRNQLKEWWKPQRQLPTVEFIEEILPLQQELTETKPLSLDKYVEPEEPGANLNLQEFKVRSQVCWSHCPPHCQQFAPFEITEIDGSYAKLDLFPKLILLSELELVPS